MCRQIGILTLSSAVFAFLLTWGFGQEQYYVELSNTLRLGPGVPSETDTITTNAFQRGGGGEIQGKPIGILDDGLRLTFYNQAPRNILRIEKSTAPPWEEIVLPSAAEAARAGAAPAIDRILEVSQFNKYGRRTFSFLTPRGRVDVLQGITLLTPRFAKVEILRTQTDRFVWDTRIATSSLPAATLRDILMQAVDLTNPSSWLQIVSFYMQAERYADARQIMEEAIRRFPQLADRRNVLTQLDQLIASQKFEEIRLRQRAGQHKLAAQLLGSFPVEALPLETQIKLEDEVRRIQERLVLLAQIAEALKQAAAQLPEPDQQVIAPIIDEILADLSLETVDRLADFQRLRNDPSLAVENKVALAISGWLLGANAGVDNFAVVKSMARVRDLVREYLSGADAPRRTQILDQLRSEEGAQAAWLDQLLDTLKPPLPLPEPVADDPPGLLRAAVTTRHGATVDYVMQLPPEYDPNRKYPCVLALPGRGESPQMEIDWWCGIPLPVGDATMRVGPATRYGYIVVSPAWMEEKQADYRYTEVEKDRVLTVLRDALRRTSIDTDRVFVAGHYAGATAAWDLALSHPDLWAGAVIISPLADKYIVQYGENVRSPSTDKPPLGLYIVYGEYDGTRATSNVGTVATQYLKSPTYDCLVVEYRGRGRERFAAELPRIMEWMELSTHRRVRSPREIRCVTMRGGDRFFYWVEAPQLNPQIAGNPFQFDPAAKGVFEARILELAVNGVSINKIPSVQRAATVWLTPDMVDFSRPITIGLPGKRHRLELSPDIAVMLEDVRQRADRQHVFWQRVEIQ
ncbi:MAG: peptidase [Pirellulaceae bacterium]|nr:MAG: peptidase [Pirellulaceae bacterium]